MTFLQGSDIPVVSKGKNIMLKCGSKMSYPSASLFDEMLSGHMSAQGIIDDNGSGTRDLSGMIQENDGNILNHKWSEMVQLLRIWRRERDDTIHTPVKKTLRIGNFFPGALRRVHDNDTVSGFV